MKKLTSAFRFLVPTLLVVGVLFSGPALVLADTAGANFPDIGAEVNGPGNVVWSDEGNITADDSNFATSVLGVNATSEYLQATDFDFSIPSTATINGIQVSINRQSSSNGGGNSINDVDLNLLKAGSIVGTDKAVTTDWPTAMAVANYGGTSDLWGTTWTPGEINASNFGVSLSVLNQSGSTTRTASVDYITVTVTFTPADTTPPTAVWDLQSGSDSGSSSSDNLTNAASPIINLDFNETVSGLTSGDLSNAGTATGCSFAVGTEQAGNVYPITVSSCTEGTLIPTLAASGVTDGAGNPNASTAGLTVTIDRTGTTVTINQGTSQVDPTIATPILFNVVFSEPVLNFVVGDVTLSGTATRGSATLIGTGPAYTVSVPVSTTGTVIAAINAGVASDTAGNTNAASTSTDNTVTFNSPVITATAGAGGTITPSGAVSIAYNGNQTFTITPSANNIVADVLVNGGSVGRVNTRAFSNVTTNQTIGATFDAGWTAPTGFSDFGGDDVTDEAEAFTSNDLSTDMDDDGDDVDFTNFGGFGIVAGSTIDGIEVALEGSRQTDRSLILSLSWNGGTTFTATKTLNFTTSESTIILGGPSDDWGHTWTPSELANSSFVVRVITGSQSGDINLDQLQVKVHYTADTTEPETTILTNPANPSNSSSATFTFSSSEVGSTFECSLDGGEFTVCTSPHTYVGPLSETDPLDEFDVHTFFVRAVDPSGNTDGSPAIYFWTIDLTPPPAPTIDTTPANPDNSINFSFTFHDTEAGVSFLCRLDADSFTACNAGTFAGTTLAGARQFDVKAKDTAGNESAVTSFNWLIDTVKPVTVINSAVDGNTNAVVNSTLTNSNDISITFSATDNASGVAGSECDVDGAGYSACTSPKAYSDLADGEHTVSIRSTDNAGNLESTATLTWTVDTTPPVITVLGNDPESVTYGENYVDAGATTTEGIVIVGGDVVTSSSPVDSYTITYNATDAAGNAATEKTRTVNVVAREITVTADAGQNKVYGDADPLSYSYTLTSGALAIGDSFTGALSRVAGENVGPHAITQGDLDVNANYDITFVSADFEITAKTINVSADNDSKTYGEDDPTLTYTADALSFTDSFTGNVAREAGEDVDTYAINQGDLALSSNYNLVFTPGVFTINKADAVCTVSGTTVTYDGTAHGATGSCLGAEGEILVGLDLGASYTDVPGGTANWTFTDVTGNYNDTAGFVSIVINKADANIVVTDFNGVYDGAPHGVTGTATGVLDETLSGLDLGGTYTDVPGGIVSWTFIDSTGNYNDDAGTANVNISKADAEVLVSGYTGVYDALPHGATGTATGVGLLDLSAGLDLGASFTNAPGGTANWTFDGGTNYEDESGSVEIEINKADAVITVTPYDVTYDGFSHTATGSALGVEGEPLAGLDLSGTTHTTAGDYNDNWTFTDVTGNYNNDSDTVNDKINAATAICDVDGVSTTYDGNSHGATGTCTGLNDEILTGLVFNTEYTDVPGGTVNWTFTNSNYGSQSGSVEVAILALELTGNFTADNKVYDGNNSATVLTRTLDGVVGLDDVSLTGGAATFADAGVGDDKVVTLTGATLDGTDSGNYSLGTVNTTTADITEADAVCTISGTTVTYDGAAHGATGSCVGVEGELSGLVLGATYTDVPGGNAHWVFTDVTGNYEDQSGDVAITINKADADITVTGYTVPFDGNPHTATGSATGVNSEDLSAGLDLSGTTHTAAGSYPTDAWTFEGGTNYNDAAGTVADSIGLASTTTVVTCSPDSLVYTGSALTPCTVTVTGPNGLSLTPDPVYTDNTDVGTAHADYTFAGDSNYDTSSGSDTFEITKATTATVITCPVSEVFTSAAIEPCSASVTGANLVTTAPVTYDDNIDVGTATAHAAYTGDDNHFGSTATDATFEITQADAVCTITGFSGPYDGAAHGATGSCVGVGSDDEVSGLDLGLTFTDAPGGTAHFTFDGGDNYADQEGDVAITITQVDSTTVVTCPASDVYTGSPLTPCSVLVSGVNLNLTPAADYADNTDVGTATASYTFAGDTNHTGSSGSDTFEITTASATVTISDTSAVYDGNPHGVTVVTNPLGLTVDVTYDGSATSPTDADSYDVVATIVDDNYTGSNSDTLVISKASSTTLITCPVSASYTGLALTPCTAVVTGAGSLNLATDVDYTNNINVGTADAAASYAGDANHEGSNDTETFAIVDAGAPVIAPHGDVLASATGTLTVVNYTNPTATDDVDGSVTVVCTPASGTSFAITSTLVTCEAEDSAGNDATPVTFNVIVSDTTAPVITLNGSTPVDITVGGSYTELGASSSDLVDGTLPAVVGGDTVDTNTVGTYIVSYSKTDAHGNVATPVTRTVNVNDLPAPVITLQDAGSPTDNSITVTWTTDHASTSRVVYDTVSHPVLGAPENYGYAFSTVEDGNLVTSHSVVVTGLSNGTTYYFRGVSHGSPESVSDEVSETTTTPEADPACSDGEDNDGDTLVDFPSDPGCVDGNDNDEINEVNPPVNPGSITVCKIVTDSEGNVVAGVAGTTFTVPFVDAIYEGTAAGVPASAVFNTPIAQNTVFGDVVGECTTINNLALGRYYYGEENISNASSWEAPKYNDQVTGPATSLSDFGLFNTDLDVAYDDFDGVINLTEGIPARTILVLNQMKEVIVPPTTATINAVKIVCPTEDLLPNWGAGAANITANTAEAFLEAHPTCTQEDWTFEWAPTGTANPGDQTGVAGGA